MSAKNTSPFAHLLLRGAAIALIVLALLPCFLSYVANLAAEERVNLLVAWIVLSVLAYVIRKKLDPTLRHEGAPRGAERIPILPVTHDDGEEL